MCIYIYIMYIYIYYMCIYILYVYIYIYTGQLENYPTSKVILKLNAHANIDGHKVQETKFMPY